MAISLLTGGNLAQKGYRTTGYRLIFFKGPFGGAYFEGAYIRRGSSTEGNLRFKIDWASLIVARKFSIFSLFYFVFEGNFPSTSPRGAYIWRGDLTEGFLRYRFWRGLFSEFYSRLVIFFSLKRPIKGPQKTYSRNSTNGHLSTTATLFCTGGQSTH